MSCDLKPQLLSLRGGLGWVYTCFLVGKSCATGGKWRGGVWETFVLPSGVGHSGSLSRLSPVTDAGARGSGWGVLSKYRKLFGGGGSGPELVQKRTAFLMGGGELVGKWVCSVG